METRMETVNETWKVYGKMGHKSGGTWNVLTAQAALVHANLGTGMIPGIKRSENKVAA